MTHQRSTTNFIFDSDKRVIDTIEVGELRSKITLGVGAPSGTPRVPNVSSRVAHDYAVFVNYTFSYSEKEGEVSGFGIARAEKEDEKFECDGVGENIAAVLLDLFKADYHRNDADQIDDLVSEVMEMVQDQAKANNWLFFNTSYDKQVHYES
jgi:hypothetical protein